MDVRFLHLRNDVPIALQSQYGRKVLFCCGKTVRATTDVVGSGLVVHQYILECIGGTSDDEILSQQASGFGNGHVELTEVNPIGLDLFHDFYMIVDDEGSPMLPAHCQCFLRDGQDFFGRSILHAELDPSASTFKGDAYRVEISVSAGIMSDELYHGLTLRKPL